MFVVLLDAGCYSDYSRTAIGYVRTKDAAENMREHLGALLAELKAEWRALESKRHALRKAAGDSVGFAGLGGGPAAYDAREAEFRRLAAEQGIAPYGSDYFAKRLSDALGLPMAWGSFDEDSSVVIEEIPELRPPGHAV